MTYLWQDGIAVVVRTDRAGRPEQFAWNGRLHPIEKIINRWIIDDYWWEIRTWRDYYAVATATHLLLVLFRDMLTEQWYIQRLYD